MNELIMFKGVCRTAPATPGLIMMVDLMFMMVHNLRLFLTAVTPTEVAPTAVI